MGFEFSDRRISLLIGEQVPQFLHEHGPLFIKFIEKYYEWVSTSKVVVQVEYYDDNVPDIEFNLEDLLEEDKPKIKGVHTNSLSKILSYTKIDRNNYIFQVKHFNQDFNKSFPLEDSESYTKYSSRVEITKGYSEDENLLFINSPHDSLTEIDDNGNQNVKIKVKSFIQQSEISTRNTWNSNDVDLSLNSLIDIYMKEFLSAYPLTFPNEDEILDINDKINQNYTVEDFKRFLVKHSREFYRSKGTEDSFRYLFRTVFNKEIDIQYPYDNLLKASDNTYIETDLINVSHSSNFLDLEIVSKFVYGESSGASGVVEKYTIKKNANIEYLQIELNSETINGNFLINENIRVLTDDGVYVNIGECLPSVSNVKVLDSSTKFFEIGERFYLDKNLNIIEEYKIPSSEKSQYLYLEVEKVQSGKIFGLNIIESGNNYKVGDKIIFNNTDTYLKSRPHRFVKAYVSKVCEYGSIKGIKVTTEGFGYLKFPKIESIGGRIYDESDEKNAKISFISDDIGKAKVIKIINSGFGYDITKNKSDLNGDSNFDLEIVYSGLNSRSGKILYNYGILSNYNYLQDSSHYQKFSYVIKSDVSPKEYRSLVKRLVHPAGSRFFGEYRIVTQVKSNMKIHKDGTINELEMNDRNYIGRYSDLVLDQWNLYDNFDRVEIRQNDLIPTVIQSEDDYKFHKLSGIVNLERGSNIVNGIDTNFSSSLSSGDFIMIDNQGFYVESINNDLELVISQDSNETLESQNILLKTLKVDTAG